MSELTHLLRRVQAGDVGARETLFAAAYSDLERLARARLRHAGHSTLLDARSLVHESYLRYLKGGTLRAEDRRAFFAYVSQVMHSLVVSYARERAAQKRGSGWRPVTLSTRVAEQASQGADEILRVHEALDSLGRLDARLAQVVRMRYFGGYTEQEIAETLDVTERTVQRLWLKAKLILQAVMEA